MYLTVLCLSYTLETPPCFPSQKLLLLRQTTGRVKKKKKTKTTTTTEKKNPGNQRQSAHKECWVRLMKINDPPPIIYSK